MPERTDWSALDDTLARFLQEPSHASRILTTAADVLVGDPFLTINAWTLDHAVRIAAHQVTDGLPDAVAAEADRLARLALPLAHPGETCDCYALRLRDIARTV
ncbi:hypothetical protein [Streptomyces lavendulocolor]|uniref:hypothetical protein n=1 Tax=Streptomyces lavendulocolor TaxID=67316 RepID=UPI003C2B9AD7